MFVRGRLFQLSLMLVSKPETYPSEAPFRGYTFGELLAIPFNIKVGCLGQPGTNTLAYLAYNLRIKKFHNIVTRKSNELKLMRIRVGR